MLLSSGFLSINHAESNVQAYKEVVFPLTENCANLPETIICGGYRYYQHC
jgi:hypothetical protein